MAAMIRPTVVLEMSLDERVFSEESAAELRRSYAHVSSPLVVSHAPGEGEPENILRFQVKIRKPYWNSADEGADELWNEVMKTWFSNMFYKISSTIASFNENKKENHEEALLFSRIDVELEGGNLVIIPLEEDGTIPEGAVALLEAARAGA